MSHYDNFTKRTAHRRIQPQRRRIRGIVPRVRLVRVMDGQQLTVSLVLADQADHLVLELRGQWMIGWIAEGHLVFRIPVQGFLEVRVEVVLALEREFYLRLL